MRRLKIAVFLSLLFVVAGLPGSANARKISESSIFSISPGFDSQSRSSIGATLRHVSEKAYLYVEDKYWDQYDQDDQGRITDRLIEIGNDFDEHLYPEAISFLGDIPNPGIDNDPRVSIMFADLSSNIGGYFDEINSRSKQEYPESNERELIFVNVSILFSSRVFSFLAHEFQHLINYNQKIVGRGVVEETWLNELRSEFLVDQLGYNEDFENSTLSRRANDLKSDPTASLTYWNNTVYDYAQIALFAKYVADTWAPEIITDSINSAQISMHSINDALTRNGYEITHKDLYKAWQVTNIINDSNLARAFAYTDPSLGSFKIDPREAFSGISDASNFTVTKQFTDWQTYWYSLSNFNPTSLDNLKISFHSSKLSSFEILYIVETIDGQKVAYFTPLNVNNAELVIESVVDVKTIYFTPLISDRWAGFQDKPNFIDFSAIISLTNDTANREYAVVFNPSGNINPINLVSINGHELKEGDFIRAVGDNDVYIINDFNFKRLVLNPSICLQYNHLGSRGCFDAVKTVAPNVRDAFKTSMIYTNGDIENGPIYEMKLLNDDQASLEKISDSLQIYISTGHDYKKVFLFNTLEQKNYF